MSWRSGTDQPRISVLEDGSKLVVVGCGESVPELVVKLTPPSSAPALAASSGSPVPVVGDSPCFGLGADTEAFSVSGA